MGRDGMDILYHYAVFSGVLERHTPKKVILCLTPLELSSIDNYDRLAKLLPYKNLNSIIIKTAFLKDPFEKYKCISKIYPYNSTLIQLLKGYLSSNPKPENGYVPIYGSNISSKTKPTVFKSDSILNPNRVLALEEFIKTAKSKKIDLTIVMSPWYLVENSNTKTVEEIYRISEKYSIDLIDYTVNPNYTGKPEKFFDEGHLNHENAVLFTEMIISNIVN
jgi:hypothetical protein